MTEKYDVLIIGSGPGGYVCAIRAAQLGLKTAIVERDQMGGVCLNWGCIPTKALLRSAEILRSIKHAGEFGFKLGGAQPEIDFEKVVARSRQVSGKLSKGIDFLMKKNAITVFKGTAQLSSKSTVTVKKPTKKALEIEADHIVIATGARPRALPDLEVDEKVVWSYKTALEPDKLPKSMLIVGSGAIGSEFASFYNEMGTDVTLVELQNRILPVEDEEISKAARKSFEKQGIEVLTDASVQKLVTHKGMANATITISGGSPVEKTFERAIVAIGVVGNVENLGLDAVGVKTSNGAIQTNEWGETNVQGIWAIGDVAGAPWLAHKASHEGTIVAECIANVEIVHPLNPLNVPGCTYTHPQIASVGLTEAQAREAGHKFKVGRFPFKGNGKAIALGEDEGFIKTIVCSETAELLGAHMIGAEVTEMIQGYVIARDLEATTDELSATIFPHPTLSEMMHESILDAEDRVLHI